MTELWVKKLPIDVHRLVDNKLPEGSKCTGIAMTSLDEGMVEEYVATINGEEVIVQGPAEESASDVADAIVAQAPPPKNPPPLDFTPGAQAEGEDAPTETQAEPMFGTQPEPEYEYDDSSEDDEGWEEDPEKPKSKSKAKSKKK